MTHQRDTATSSLRPLLPVPALGVAIVLFLWIGGVTAFQGAKGGAAQDVEIALAFDREVPLPTVRLIQVYRSGFSAEILPERGTQIVSRGDAQAEWWKSPPVRREFRWSISERWARDFRIEITEASLPFFQDGWVQIGGTTRPMPMGRLRELSGPGQDHARSSSLPAAEIVRVGTLFEPPRSLLPWFDGLLNYPGDLHFMGWWLQEWLTHPFTWVTAIWFGAAAFFAWLHRRNTQWGRRLLIGLGESFRPSLRFGTRIDCANSRGGIFFLAGLGLVIAAAIYLERREPRYFLRDDNFSIFFPAIDAVGRALAAGRFPEWTPRVFLGMPVAELGVFAATYPPTWISYALADLLIGDPSWTVDVFCWGHLVCGYGACFRVLRRNGLHPSVAAAAGMSWALCGFALIAGRSWYYMTPVFAYLPMIAGMLHALVEEGQDFRRTKSVDRTWIWRWGVVWGFFFHAGNAQMWLYAAQLFALWVLWAGYRRRLGRAAVFRLVRGTVLGLAMAAPLLIPQFFAVRSVQRPSGPDHGIQDAVGAIFLPYPLAECRSPSDWADPANRHAGHFYYAGTLFAVAWLLSSAAAMGLPRVRRRWFADPWTPVALMALWLAMGNEGGLWWLQSRMPVLGAVYHPFKYLPFVHLATIFVGARVLHHLFFRQAAGPYRPAVGAASFARGNDGADRQAHDLQTSGALSRPSATNRRAIGLFAASSLLITWHIIQADSTFYAFGDRTYVDLPPSMAEILRPGEVPARIMPVTPFRSPAPRFVWGLGLNFPLVYRLESIDGYGEFVRQTPENRAVEAEVRRDPRAALRAYGVTHLVLHRCAVEPCLSGARDAGQAESETLYRDARIQELCRSIEPIFHNDSVAVFALADAAPRAFGTAEGAASQSGGGIEARLPGGRTGTAVALPMRVEETRVVVDTAALTQGGEVTVNYLRRPRSRVWLDGRPAQPSADGYGRLVVRIAPGTREVVVGYAGNWIYGCLTAAGLLIVFAATGRIQPALFRKPASFFREAASPRTDEARQ